MDSLNLLQNGSLKSLAQMDDLLALEGRVRVDFGSRSEYVFVVQELRMREGVWGIYMEGQKCGRRSSGYPAPALPMAIPKVPVGLSTDSKGRVYVSALSV